MPFDFTMVTTFFNVNRVMYKSSWMMLSITLAATLNSNRIVSNQASEPDASWWQRSWQVWHHSSLHVGISSSIAFLLLLLRQLHLWSFYGPHCIHYFPFHRYCHYSFFLSSSFVYALWWDRLQAQLQLVQHYAFLQIETHQRFLQQGFPLWGRQKFPFVIAEIWPFW